MIKTFCMTALAVLAVGSAAQAQPFRGGSATLYDQPNFQGNSVTITQSAPDLGKWRFNDRAQSARFEGRWLICEHDNFKGRCQEVRGEITNLHTLGLMAQVSSIEPVGGRPGGGGGPGPGPMPGFPGRPDGRGTDGTATVFFPRPTLGGMDVAAGDRGADMYCRRQGLGSAAWYDSSTRAGQAIGPDGQMVGRSTVIRDLLCRKY